MDMQEARDIAVRFLGGLPVTDNEVFEAGELIRKVFRQNGLADDHGDTQSRHSRSLRAAASPMTSGDFALRT